MFPRMSSAIWQSFSRFSGIPPGSRSFTISFRVKKNVTEICDDLEMNQSAVSHQLKILKVSKLITSRRDGKAVYYRLADEHVKTIIAMGKEHIEE